MPFEFTEISSLVLSLSIAIVAVLSGIIFQRVILSKLRKIAARTRWKGDDIIINALKGIEIPFPIRTVCLNKASDGNE